MASKSSTTACQTAWNPDQQPIPFANPWGRPGAYTTMLVDGDPPTPLFLDRHLRRLKKCLGYLGLPEIFRDAFLEESILETASGINTVPCMLRTSVVPEGLFITAYPQSGKGARLHGRLCRIRRKLPAAKSLLDISLHEEMQTVNRNCEELLLVSPDGHVLEGATTNLLFVRGKNILAPEKDTLTGITRQVLEERIPKPWQWEVTDVHLDDLPTAVLPLEGCNDLRPLANDRVAPSRGIALQLGSNLLDDNCALTRQRNIDAGAVAAGTNVESRHLRVDARCDRHHASPVAVEVVSKPVGVVALGDPIAWSEARVVLELLHLRSLGFSAVGLRDTLQAVGVGIRAIRGHPRVDAASNRRGGQREGEHRNHGDLQESRRKSGLKQHR